MFLHMLSAKICGLRTEDAAQKAVDSGADLLGIILVPGRKRTVDLEVAKKISGMVKLRRLEANREYKTVRQILSHLSTLKFNNIENYFIAFQKLILENGPFLVGVFRNQSIEEVFSMARNLDLDLIQLHGSENKENYLSYNERIEGLRFAIIPRYVLPRDEDTVCKLFRAALSEGQISLPGLALPLLDTELGGEGKKIDWDMVNHLKGGKYILAGGLTPNNILEAKLLNNVLGFDVSGGVEDDKGDKDFAKIELFVSLVKKT